jgi:hypothetical protein
MVAEVAPLRRIAMRAPLPFAAVELPGMPAGPGPDGGKRIGLVAVTNGLGGV